MNEDQLIGMMKSMIEAQDWQGYLHVRRTYITGGGKQGTVSRMTRSLPDEQQIIYGRYFKSYRDLCLRVRKLLIEEDLLKADERRRAYEERKNAESVWDKPVKRQEVGEAK